MQEFLKEFRPQGFGEMNVQDLDTGEIIMESRVWEVVCDICNRQLGDKDTVNMFFKDSYAVCDECAKNLKDDKG